MKQEVIDSSGMKVQEIELNDVVFSSKVSEGSLYYSLNNQLANARLGTAVSKGRSDVNYSKRKPWRQKGTGRARAGSRGSPLWVGGGVVFGPQQRDYGSTVPKKIRVLAYRSLLTKRLKDGSLRIIELEEPKSEKTKDFNLQMLPFNKEKKNLLLIIADDNALLKRVGKNIPWFRVLSYNKLELKHMLYCSTILVAKEAALKLNSFLDKEWKDAKIS